MALSIDRVSAPAWLLAILASCTEFNIVRQFRRLGSWEGRPGVFRVPVASFPSDATRVAVLLQRSEQGPIAASAAASLR